MTENSNKSNGNSKDFFDLYFDYVWDNTESPRIFHRWGAISCIAASLGRQTWLEFGHKTIYPNQMILLVGDPGTRKSSAIDVSKELLKETGYNTFAPTRTSKEKFLQDLADRDFSPDGKEEANLSNLGEFSMNGYDRIVDLDSPSECYICSGEFNTFVGHNNAEFLGILGDLYDNPSDFEVKNKTSKSGTAIKPTINILGGNTQQGIAQSMPPEMVGQGLFSRFIFVFGKEQSQRLFWPEKADPEIKQSLTELLLDIRSNVHGPITATSDAKEIFKLLYDETNPWVEDGRFHYYNSRRYTHLLKLCVVLAASRLKTVIDVEEVLLANSILVYTEMDMHNCLGEFGKAKLADLNSKVMQLLLSHPEGWDTHQLYSKLNRDCNGVKEIQESLLNLKMAGKVTTDTLGFKFIPVVKEKKQVQGIVDFTLLREYRENHKAKVIELRKG